MKRAMLVVLGAIAFAVRLSALRRIALPIYERKGVLSKKSNGGH